ncbi:MAG TPA: Mur ligase family protein, partial [bacterium]|nr:Mur ligase family protein [bacterium]
MHGYFFVGIGGSGMSSIAQILAGNGVKVKGSDRSRDRGQNEALFKRLEFQGIELFPQDGSGVTGDLECVVVSTAIEDTIPDIKRAREIGVPIKHRSQALAEIFNAKRGIAVGGTSGKSTVCGMIGTMLHHAGFDPSIINGGRMKNFVSDGVTTGAVSGKSDIIVIESDESDGSIINYRPECSIITNVTKDHKTVEELITLFETFIRNTEGSVVINKDCPVASSLNTSGKKIITYGLETKADIVADILEQGLFSSVFKVEGTRYELSVPGRHNISNALSAVAAGKLFGMSDGAVAEGIAAFKGISRRFDLIGEARGVKVIDDFGHNPDKIRATIESLDKYEGRRLFVFQPH